MNKVDFHAYIDGLTKTNKLAAGSGFFPCRCSGITQLEELLQNFREQQNFVCSSDICDESTTMTGGTFFKRRLVTVFILARFTFGDMDSYTQAMDTCRELFRQFKSKFIHDATDFSKKMIHLRADEIRSSELGGHFLNGATGLYFMIAYDEPENLCYNPDEWN